MEEVGHLAHERNRAQFDVEAIKIVWAVSRHAFEVSDQMSRLVASDPVFRKDNRATLSMKELFKNTLKKATYARKRIFELRISGFHQSEDLKSSSYNVTSLANSVGVDMENLQQ